MVYPEGSGLLCQAALNAVLQNPDHPRYLPVGFAVTNGDVEMDDPHLFTESCKAT